MSLGYFEIGSQRPMSIPGVGAIKRTTHQRPPDYASNQKNRLLASGSTSVPWWSRDGRYVYFSEIVAGTAGLDGFRRLADGSEDAEQLYRRDRFNPALSISSDGTQLLVMDDTQDRGWDLVIMSEDRDSVIFTGYLRADWNETMATISPDGARAAYVSDQSSIPEVYIRSFPDAEDQVRVSVGGGTEPVWARDGSAIYYRNGNRVLRASITPGDVFSVETPQQILEGSWVLETQVPLPGPTGMCTRMVSRSCSCARRGQNLWTTAVGFPSCA